MLPSAEINLVDYLLPSSDGRFVVGMIVLFRIGTYSFVALWQWNFCFVHSFFFYFILCDSLFQNRLVFSLCFGEKISLVVLSNLGTYVSRCSCLFCSLVAIRNRRFHGISRNKSFVKTICFFEKRSLCILPCIVDVFSGWAFVFRIYGCKDETGWSLVLNMV